jgi:hypothetical protein
MSSVRFHDRHGRVCAAADTRPAARGRRAGASVALGLTLALASLGPAEGCASGEEPELSPGTGGRGVDGSAGSPSSGGGGGTGGSDGGISVSDASDAPRCVEDTVTADPVPLTMVVLLDRSGSMGGGAGSKFDVAAKALRGFADSAGVVGMRMGLQFFPPKAGSECDEASYRRLAVPIDVLPDNTLKIADALATTTVTGSTPMVPALKGTIDAVRIALDVDHPQEGVVILVTDGDPGGCNSTVSGVVSVASAAANPTDGRPRVTTFAVGMAGATFGNLDQIAAAGGGSTTAFNVGEGPEAQQKLLDALEQIRRGSLGCEYKVPDPGLNRELDLDSVEVLFTPGLNDPALVFKRVESAEKCGETTGGYYYADYDDDGDPARIVLCDASCKQVRGGTLSATIEIRMGCIYIPV